MTGKIHEFVFPRSYLIDYVEERPPYNGKVRNLFNGGICDKTIASDSITQRMFLITSNIKTVEFRFGLMHDITQLLYFQLNGSEVVSNSAEDSQGYSGRSRFQNKAFTNKSYGIFKLRR